MEVGKVVPQELPASRKRQTQSTPICSLGIFRWLPWWSHFSFSRVTQPAKALLISVKPAARSPLIASQRAVAPRPRPREHRALGSSQGTHGLVAVIHWSLIFTW